MRPGPQNLISDVAGLLVGNAEDARIRTGVTVLTADRPFTAAVHVMGGAPGTRETAALDPGRLVGEADAIVLSGGSSLGLAAGSGVADALREAGRGFAFGGQMVPFVPGAIIFDLMNGGDKGWAENPYPALGRAALAEARAQFAIGTAGAGYGATVFEMKGGLGSASCVLANGMTVGALAVVNALGKAVAGDGPQFWAAPWELDGEFGGLGLPTSADPAWEPPASKRRGQATTIAIVATDAALSAPEALRMATAAQDGIARAVVPSHTLLDGDLVFGVATGERPITDPVADQYILGHAAACCLARAIARAVYLATPMEGDIFPAWSVRFGGSSRR
jgi:D-aminopeptidase